MSHRRGPLGVGPILDPTGRDGNNKTAVNLKKKKVINTAPGGKHKM